MVEYKLEHKNHMGAWFIDEIICDKILKFFYDNPKFHHKGKSYFPDKKTNNTVIEYDKDVKESLEMEITFDVFEKPLDEYRDSLQKVLDNYIKRYDYLNTMQAFNINENYKIQTYPKGGGFKQWHVENTSPNLSKRVLVFMTYLNDVPDGGTMFKDQDIIVPAKKGLTLIWPAGFTHVHKGQITDKYEKQIVTGWYSYYE